MLKKVSVVVPVYNESGNIPEMINRLDKVFNTLQYRYEYIFVDDGSADKTAELLKDMHDFNGDIHYVQLSKNFGHQNALKAGIDMATGDCVISMDGDLQHPPELLPEFLRKWEEGYEIVYSRRTRVVNISRFKEITSNLFYNMLNQVSEIELEPGTADFRLIDRKVADVLLQFNEIDPFLRGIVKWVGFSQYAIDYAADSRFAGKSKYSLKKMFKFGLQGITSFSIKPLYTAVYMGFIFTLLSFLYFPYVLYGVITGKAAAGWASIITTVVFFSGLQIMIMGVVGIYIGKIFLQTKLRPGYIVKNTSLKKRQHDTFEF